MLLVTEKFSTTKKSVVITDRYISVRSYQVVSENGVLGLLVDATTVECDEHEPIFLDNDAPDLFVAAHFQEYKEFPFAEISADSLQRMQVPDILKLDSTSVTRH